MTHWSWLSLFYLTGAWAIRVIMLVYVPQRRTAAAARTWLLLIFLAPWPGLLLYYLFGRIYLPGRRIQMQERASQAIRQAQEQIGARVAVQPLLPDRLSLIPEQARLLGDFEPFGGNRIEVLTDYFETIDFLIADIKAAKRQVNLLFYIFGTDETGEKVADALMIAASRGVRCRLLLDAVASRRSIQKLGPKLRKAGIEVREMLPVGLFRRNAARFDLRNHRKIAVIDGCIGYTGSQNIVNPGFVREHPNEELVLRLTGPIVAQLQAVFLADHYFETWEVIDRTEFFPEITHAGDSVAQLVPSGPGYNSENGQELMISLLYSARQRVVITTPYFVPDQPFLQALQSVSQHRGVEVHLILSKYANQLLSQLAQRSYYEDLLDAGVHIHLYLPRFLHAKHLTVDGELAVVGTTNIDIRSFALNAEINVLIYDVNVVGELQKVQERYFRQSEKLDPSQWRKRPLGTRVLQNTARLMDSFL
jgi:cardiolipin synthase A/B